MPARPFKGGPEGGLDKASYVLTIFADFMKKINGKGGYTGNFPFRGTRKI